MGGMPGSRANGPHRSQPSLPQAVQRSLPLSLEDLYNGGVKRLKVTRKQTGADSEKILQVNIKPGWKAGTKIKFPAEGDDLPGGGAQDIEVSKDFGMVCIRLVDTLCCIQYAVCN